METLPFADATFDCARISFGIATSPTKIALVELLRVLKPGAPLLVLEFSKPRSSSGNRSPRLSGVAASWQIAGR